MKTEYMEVIVRVLDNGYSIMFRDYRGPIDSNQGYYVAHDLNEVKTLMKQNFIELKIK